MIADPYICIKGKHIGKIQWFGDCFTVHSTYRYKKIDNWQPYADFEREKLKELETRSFYVDAGEGYFWHRGCVRAWGSRKLLGYSGYDYTQDSESNRLLKRAEFLKAVCKKEGVEWLPEEKIVPESKKCEEKCRCYDGAPHVCKDGEALLSVGTFECLCPCKCHLHLTETHTIEPEKKCSFISKCCDRDPCKCGKEEYGAGGRCKPEEPKPECEHRWFVGLELTEPKEPGCPRDYYTKEEEREFRKELLDYIGLPNFAPFKKQEHLELKKVHKIYDFLRNKFL